MSSATIPTTTLTFDGTFLFDAVTPSEQDDLAANDADQTVTFSNAGLTVIDKTNTLS